jgi:hypothetical protein
MGLMEQLKADIEQITSNTSEFAVDLSLVAPTGETASIQGLYSDHSNAYDESGVPIVGKFTHVSISEALLTAEGYPTRNAAGLASMTGHKVTVNYADGSVKTYICDKVLPDYSINLFLLILSEYNGVD